MCIRNMGKGRVVAFPVAIAPKCKCAYVQMVELQIWLLVKYFTIELSTLSLRSRLKLRFIAQLAMIRFTCRVKRSEN